MARDYSIGELGAARCIAIIPEGFMSDDRKLQEAVLAELGWEPRFPTAQEGVADAVRELALG